MHNHKSMQLIINEDNARWSFPRWEMRKQIKKYGGKEWTNKEEIKEHIKDFNGFYVIGYITEETADKWDNIQNINKEPKLTKLWVVSLHNTSFALCLSSGMVVL